MTAIPQLTESEKRGLRLLEETFGSSNCRIYPHLQCKKLALQFLFTFLNNIFAYLRTHSVHAFIHITLSLFIPIHIYVYIYMYMNLTISWNLCTTVDGQLPCRVHAVLFTRPKSTCIGDPLWLPIWVKRVIDACADFEKKIKKENKSIKIEIKNILYCVSDLRLNINISTLNKSC